MSSEIERRLKAIEAKLSVSIPCAHKLPILDDPSEAEIATMDGILAACPNCRTPRLGFPRMVIFWWPKPETGAVFRPGR